MKIFENKNKKQFKETFFKGEIFDKSAILLNFIEKSKIIIESYAQL